MTKKFRIKKVYLFFSSLCIFILHMPFVFAKSNPFGKMLNDKKISPVVMPDSSLMKVDVASNIQFGLYDSLRLGSLGLGRQVFNYAMKGFSYMRGKGTLANENIITIVDFSKPSSEKRMFIIDLRNCKILFNTYVAHGMQSGKEFANQFSNRPSSNKSSLGFYETLGTYVGGNGYSLRLQGMERGINDNANMRDIVIHGADYVNESLIHSQGYIGRSWGCPAVPRRLHKSIINKIKDGTCLFIYSPEKKYLASSKILNSHFSSPAFALN